MDVVVDWLSGPGIREESRGARAGPAVGASLQPGVGAGLRDQTPPAPPRHARRRGVCRNIVGARRHEMLAEASAIVDRTGERSFEAELHRLKGELLLQSASRPEAQAEACFRKAIEIAR